MVKAAVVGEGEGSQSPHTIRSRAGSAPPSRCAFGWWWSARWVRPPLEAPARLAFAEGCGIVSPAAWARLEVAAGAFVQTPCGSRAASEVWERGQHADNKCKNGDTG